MSFLHSLFFCLLLFFSTEKKKMMGAWLITNLFVCFFVHAFGLPLSFFCLWKVNDKLGGTDVGIFFRSVCLSLCCVSSFQLLCCFYFLERMTLFLLSFLFLFGFQNTISWLFPLSLNIASRHTWECFVFGCVFFWSFFVLTPFFSSWLPFFHVFGARAKKESKRWMVTFSVFFLVFFWKTARLFFGVMQGLRVWVFSFFFLLRVCTFFWFFCHENVKFRPDYGKWFWMEKKRFFLLLLPLDCVMFCVSLFLSSISLCFFSLFLFNRKDSIVSVCLRFK